MAYISKGLTLALDENSGAPSLAALIAYFDAMSITDNIFPNLQEIGEISIAGAGGSYDQIEVTTLADAKHVYVDGLIADADSGANEISFKFLYEPTLFKAFKDAMKAETDNANGSHGKYNIAIPSGGTFKLTADIGSIKLDSISTNSALTFTLALAVREIEMEAPSAE